MEEYVELRILIKINKGNLLDNIKSAYLILGITKSVKSNNKLFWKNFIAKKRRGKLLE